MSFGGKKQTVGYKYYLGLHFGCSHGPVDALKEIRVGDRTAWEGSAEYRQQIFIDKDDLFGGKKREGGVKGYADVLMGDSVQPINDYLQTHISGPLPAFRRMFSIVYRGGYVAANNPYIKPWAFKVHRCLQGWHGPNVEIPITETAGYGVDPWLDETDPRNPLNTHIYRAYNVYSGPIGPWRSTLSEALSDDQAYRGYSVSPEPIGWHRMISSTYANLIHPYIPTIHPWSDAGDYPYYAHATGIESQSIALHFISQSPSAYIGYASSNSSNACNFLPLDGSVVWWTGLLQNGSSYANGYPGNLWTVIDGNLPTPAGWVHHNSCAGNLKQIRRDDTVVQCLRVAGGPHNPCEGYPDDPDDPNFCIIDDEQVHKRLYTLVSQQNRQLQVFEESDSTGWSRRNIGPIVPVGDPNFNNQAYWDALYAQAVSDGVMFAGLPYNPGGGFHGYGALSNSYYVYQYNTVQEQGAWEPDLACIGDDMNPAHIIYQCIIDSDWGMGYPAASINVEPNTEGSFLDAAQALYDELFGLSFLWVQQQPVEDFIITVLNHIGAVWYADPRTGKFCLKLIRDDYVLSDLRVLDETNIVSMDSYQKVGYGELVNQIVVTYTDINNTDTKTKTTPPVQDQACIQAQAAVIGETRDYSGITKDDLAIRVAQRDVNAAATPLSKCKLKLNRTCWDIIPGEAVRFSWDKLGLELVVMRVLSVDTGTIDDGQVIVDIAEDVFGLPLGSYAAQESEAWSEPDLTAGDIEIEDLMEIPYWDLATQMTAADFAQLDDDFGGVAAVAHTDNGLALGFNLYSHLGVNDYEEQALGAFAPTAVLVNDITRLLSDNVLQLESDFDLDLVEVGGRVMVGSGRDAELMEVTGVDLTLKQVTVERAILDTTPQEISAGTRVWFIDVGSGQDPNEYATGDEVFVKLTTQTTGDESALATANEMTITMDQRFARPYAPGNVLVGGEEAPDTVFQPVAITWAHRDRTQQTATTFIHQSDGNVGPEDGVLYLARLYDISNSSDVLDEVLTTDTSWEPNVVGTFNVRLELTAVRDGLESWQPQIRYFAFVGDGAILTENGGLILSEDNQPLIQEEDPTPTYEHAWTFNFSGSYSVQDQYLISFTPTIGSQHNVLVDAADAADFAGLAVVLKDAIEAEFPTSSAEVDSSDNVVFHTNTEFDTVTISNVVGEFMVTLAQPGYPITAGSPALIGLDLFQLNSGIYSASPTTSSAYCTGGSANMQFGLYYKSYAASKVLDESASGYGQQTVTWSVGVIAPPHPVSYSIGLTNLAAAIAAHPVLGDPAYGVSAFNGIQGAMTRNAVFAQTSGNFVFTANPIASQVSNHPSGYIPRAYALQDGTPVFPSGAKELWTAVQVAPLYQFGVSPPYVKPGMIFELVIEGVPYTYTTDSSDSNLEDVANGFAVQFDSSDDYVVTYWETTGGAQGRIEVEHVDINTPFTMTGYASYGGKLEVSGPT